LNLDVDLLWTIGAALVTIGASWAFAKHTIRAHAEKIAELEAAQDKIRAEFLTIREYELRMHVYDLRLQHIEEELKKLNENIRRMLDALGSRRTKTKVSDDAGD
jgi:chromosome segregation ATPase